MNYVIAVLFGFLGLWPTIANWETLIRWIVKKEHGSMIPLLGGIFLTLALRMIFTGDLKWLCLIGSAIDFGSIPWLLGLPFGARSLMREVKKGNISRKDASISLCIYSGCAIVMIIILCICMII